MVGGTGAGLIRLVWTPEAVDDLRRLSNYLEQERSLTIANQVCRIIYDAIQLLRRHPSSGRVGLRPGTRELVIPSLPYLVVYRIVKSEAVQILRIWHGAQDRSAGYASQN